MDWRAVRVRDIEELEMIMRFELMNNDEERFTAIRRLAQIIQADTASDSLAFECATQIEQIAAAVYEIEVDEADEEQE